jgi:hypothetical protein
MKNAKYRDDEHVLAMGNLRFCVTTEKGEQSSKKQQRIQTGIEKRFALVTGSNPPAQAQRALATDLR